MESYNKMIADELRRNVNSYLDRHSQPEALSTTLYGGKRVRDHPQVGNTAYSQDPATLIPHHTLMDDFSDLEGGKRYGVSRFVKDMNKIGKAIGIKQVTKPLTKALVKKGVEEIQGAGYGEDFDMYDEVMEGGKKKYGVSRFVKDLGKIGKAIGIKQVTKPLTKALVDKGVSEIAGAGKRPRGRPRKQPLDDCVMEGGKKKYGVSRFVKDLGKIGKAIGIKQVTKPLSKALVDKGVSEIAGAGFGQDDYEEYQGGKKYGVSRFVKDLGKISKAIGIKQITKPLTKALVDKGVAKIAGAGKRGRPRKLKMEGGASELYPPTVAKGGKRPSARGELIKKVMKEHGLKLGEASKFIKEHNLM